MKIEEYAALTGDAKGEAFKQAKLDWLRIQLHDWYEGGYDAHIEEFLAKVDDDIWSTNDETLAVRFGMWCHTNNKPHRE